MKQYLDLVRTAFEQSSWQTYRTGIRTLAGYQHHAHMTAPMAV